MTTVKITIGDDTYELPLIEGTEGERAIDIRKLRLTSGGLITLDSGYGSTGSCQSAITFIDGEKGILRYRGYSIEELAKKSSFLEVAYLLIKGNLPTKEQFYEFKTSINKHDLIHEDLKKVYEAFPTNAHPMAVLSSMLTSMSAYYPNSNHHDSFDLNMIRLLGKTRTIAAFSYKKSLGQPFIYPRNDLSYVDDFLHMLFAVPTEPYNVNPVISDALDKLLILHADHEQNCSAATVRMVGSSKGSIYPAIAAGVSALWGPAHGGANQAVIEMLEMIRKDDMNVQKYVDKAKDKNSGFRLMGFGHRVYKNFDPRALILKDSAHAVLNELEVNDPLLDVAFKLEKAALEDDYFVDRKLFPNVDFYSGTIFRALGIPVDMFTVMFAIGRLPGWLAQFRESTTDSGARIHRPRQLYIGETLRSYTPLESR